MSREESTVQGDWGLGLVLPHTQETSASGSTHLSLAGSHLNLTLLSADCFVPVVQV